MGMGLGSLFVYALQKGSIRSTSSMIGAIIQKGMWIKRMKRAALDKRRRLVFDISTHWYRYDVHS
jgi:hypothetical protein